jgi:hypothetical protein
MVPVDERERLKLFEQTVLPHLDAAYNLARWLAGNDHDAQDVTQEAACARSGFSEFFVAKIRARGCSRLSAIRFTTGCKKTVRRKWQVNSMTRR